MRYLRNENAERSLVDLLEVLASVLIQLDITPARVSELMRTSFVKAGASIAHKKHSARPHIARLAALTGLTRSEVKRIVQENYSTRPANTETAPRTLRVLAGWKTAKRYSKGGRLLPLRLGGAAPSFESLCKEFSGDIPHKAIFTELLSRGLVRLTTIKGKTMIVATRNTGSRSNGYSDKLNFISSMARAIAVENLVLLRTKQFVPAAKEISTAYFEKSVASRVSTMISALPIDRRHTKAKKLKRQGGLDVFAVVSRRA
jgi:hypothetical protein